ncbi:MULTISPECIES: endonuclease MutS2 [Halobacillus]|uniref:Endonuclease MutS2 n=1 Tax=Halobacillus halophilus (strain ATCC 35676 / DSM 2266 / JCM 20832 / KCTC 3685 / LMG 17431 / NBRC 102448 / NCIMB 2269) TaxID=866895 RepID=I0JPJ7_HALH3|nr:endonuclease MutS2 [Halobacillus halophilus]ASF40103.1 endonuclease MutS2 [Halobacillus halophilus]CCG46067.1 DNA mismatch repair protein MutS [Halobacillus halophilus DSM 2266]
MNQRILHVLEYKKIIDQLSEHAASSLGKEKAAALKPSSKLEEVKEWQLETDEAAQVLRLKGHVPLGGIFDIKPSLKRTTIGGILSALESLDVASTIYGGRQLKRFIEEAEEPEMPKLREIVTGILPLKELEQSIRSCIDEHGNVMDGASDKLRTIRSRVRTYESRVRDKMDSFTKSKTKMLSDAIVTIRNERYVLPVKQEYRGAIGGIVHDQSSSGATLFIEPQSVVDLNNQLQEARVQEKHEIEKILKELSEEIADHYSALYENVTRLGHVDFMFARAKLGKQMKASMPSMNDEGRIKMLQARHPLINEEEVVPNDIEIGEDYTSIVITGPNTGGKTVTLKLVGLCTLMAQSGLQIPALDGCEMAVFEEVYADIGDEQSIEQSLSTFSSHMTNIVDILKHVDDKTLVLFDELGAGTDPQEGAALAMSILDEVVNRNARVIATTHYPELKAYGYNREGVINASVEFDIQTLKPTYRLLIGVPGRSNAFEISRKLGLHESVITSAQEKIGVDSQSVENMIASLEESKRGAEQDYEEAERLLQEAQDLRNELKNKWDQFEQKREELYEKAEEKAEKAIRQAREEAETIVGEIRNMKSQAGMKEHEWIEARKMFDEAQPELAKKKKESKPEPQKEVKELKSGDEVKLLTLNQNGTIVEQTGKNEYQVQVGVMKVKAKRKDLEFIKAEQPYKEKPMATVKGKGYHVKTELDLRGERYEDALNRLEKYIDDALLAGYPTVSIIHGKGTGALRTAVQNYAKNHRNITNHRAGGMNEGGSGVTVLELS